MTVKNLLCLFCFFYVFCNATAISVVGRYIGAHVLFNYTNGDDGTIRTLGSAEEEEGAYGSDSPISNVSGLIQLPYHGFYENGLEYGCNSEYSHVNKSQDWIALVARGECDFSQKILNAQHRNAKGILVYDYKGQPTLMQMSHRGAVGIVAVSIEFELGNTVGMLVWGGQSVFATITKGNSHSPNGSLELQKTSIIFVSVAFMVLMLVSLAWLIFYYIQRFRLVHTHNRGRQRQQEVVRKVIAKIPSRSLEHDDQLIGEGTCAICLEVYSGGDRVRNLPCNHIFHKKCVDPWLQCKQTCPMCKVNAIKATEMGEHTNMNFSETTDSDVATATAAAIGQDPDPVTSRIDDVNASEEPCVNDNIERPLNPETPKV